MLISLYPIDIKTKKKVVLEIYFPSCEHMQCQWLAFVPQIANSTESKKPKTTTLFLERSC